VETRYIKVYRFSGRSPYLAVGTIDIHFDYPRAKYFIIADPWVYSWEPYRVIVKIQPKVPSKAVFSVTHSDGDVEDLGSDRVLDPPFGLYEKTIECRARTVGEEVFRVRLTKLVPFDPLPDEEVSITVAVREYPVRVVIVRQGAAVGMVDTRTTTLPAVRKIDTIGVLGDYEGYERDLRSVFRTYRLVFGSRLSRNIVVEKTGGRYAKIVYNGADLVVSGDIDRALPLLQLYQDYFRTWEAFYHTATYYGGEKLQ